MIAFGDAALSVQTQGLNDALEAFLDQKIHVGGGRSRRLGAIRCGVYAFFDFEGEPIYVGQTVEQIGTRIRRHLTNRRSDAVAMSVLDPFEVKAIRVWPLLAYQAKAAKDAAAKAACDGLENRIFHDAVAQSRFHAILNEKPPPPGAYEGETPASFAADIVPAPVAAIIGHPDVRIARRAQVMARLAQIIAERRVQEGLRRVLIVQAQRLEWLTRQRAEALAAGEHGGMADLFAF